METFILIQQKHTHTLNIFWLRRNRSRLRFLLRLQRFRHEMHGCKGREDDGWKLISSHFVFALPRLARRRPTFGSSPASRERDEEERLIIADEKYPQCASIKKINARSCFCALSLHYINAVEWSYVLSVLLGKDEASRFRYIFRFVIRALIKPNHYICFIKQFLHFDGEIRDVIRLSSNSSKIWIKQS